MAEISTKIKGVEGGVLGVFAKEPVPGKVKTRLCPPLTAGEAAGLYRASLEETVSALTGLGWDLVLFYAGSEAYFRETFPQVRLIPQGEGGLGERLERAFRALGERNFRRAAMVGSDSPDLPASLVHQAFAALEQADFVTAPSRDGGYVLVGQRGHWPGMFRQIPWSTPRVLEQTRLSARALGIDYREIGSWEDVDDLASLKRLIDRSPRSATARFALRTLGAHL